MNRDDRIDEEREEQHDDGPGQPTAEGADAGLEDSLATAETVDEPATGDTSSTTQVESGDNGSEGQPGPVDQREEEAAVDEQALDSSRAVEASSATNHEQDETGGHADPVDQPEEEAAVDEQALDLSRAAEVAPATDHERDETDGRADPVDQPEEEAAVDEQALDLSRAAEVAPATDHEQDETGGHAGPTGHVGGETPADTQSADELPPEEAAYSPESQPQETSGQEMTMADAELPGAPHGGGAPPGTESENGEPSFSDLQAAPGAQEEEEAPQPRVVIAAGTDERSLEALRICREKARQLHVRMHPLAARYDDERHVTIFFRSDDKVDFRKLVRELSRVLRARIEMRQLGPREQGKLCGLIGKCGYPLCCQTFLGQFTQSSIKMAKTQDLALNPLKISGVCGRLLCCLNYEQALYAEVKSRMPKVNRQVDTEFGPGRVSSLNVLKETVTVQFETMTKELPLDAVQRSEPRG